MLLQIRGVSANADAMYLYVTKYSRSVIIMILRQVFIVTTQQFSSVNHLTPRPEKSRINALLTE